MRATARKISECPARDCSGGSAERQRPVSDAQLAKVAIATRESIEGCRHRAFRCGCCGAVYLRGNDPTVLGFLDNGVLGEGWHSVK